MLTTALLAVACGPARREEAAGDPAGDVRLELVAGAGGPALTRVHVDLAPAGIGADLVLDSGRGVWEGTLRVPAGVAQTVTATAWSGASEVGSSTANVEVAQHATAIVSMTVLDTTQRPPGADHGPVLTAIVSSNAAPTSGVPVTLSVTAADPDGDAIRYSWRDSCGGTFSPAAATTTWTPTGAGSCIVTASATSRALTASKGLLLSVAARPAVTIAEDAAWASSGDPLGTYAYVVADSSYGELTSDTSVAFAAGNDEVRLVRYVVSNAGASPVAIDPVLVLSGWALRESWLALPPAVSTGATAQGTTCELLAESNALTPLCNVDEVFAGAIGDPGALGVACAASLDPPDELATPQTADVTSRAYAVAADGSDAGPAALISGKAVVPAASGGVPGRVALYLVRPVATWRTRSAPVWNGSAWLVETSVWRKLTEPTWSGACPGTGVAGESGATWGEYGWRYLVEAATDRLTGTFWFTAYATNAGAIQGSPVPLEKIDITRTIPH